MLGLGGARTMAVRVGAIAATLNVALPLMPVRVAVTLVEPEATPLASPPALTVATD